MQEKAIQSVQQLSVIIPLYNDAQYIKDTVLSCVEEAGGIFIYDNASTDGSSEICAELARQYPHVHHIRHDHNIGAFENMHKAVQDCTTPYISFVGSHDQLTPGYGSALIKTLEENPNLLLACGTIQHIDETGHALALRTEANWINDTQQMSPLDRVGVFVRKLRDCFLFYGVYRTQALKDAWTHLPVLGFDRIMITRIAARGAIAYVPTATFLARDFPKTRNSKEDRQRRADILTKSPVSKSNFHRNHEIAKTVLSLAGNDAELSKAFSILTSLNRRLHNRRRFQRYRLAIVGAALLLIAGVVSFVLQVNCQ